MQNDNITNSLYKSCVRSDSFSVILTIPSTQSEKASKNLRSVTLRMLYHGRAGFYIVCTSQIFCQLESIEPFRISMPARQHPETQNPSSKMPQSLVQSICFNIADCSSVRLFSCPRVAMSLSTPINFPLSGSSSYLVWSKGEGGSYITLGIWREIRNLGDLDNFEGDWPNYLRIFQLASMQWGVYSYSPSKIHRRQHH